VGIAMNDECDGRATIDGGLPPPGGLRLAVAAEYADRVNFGMQQNGVPLVRELAITNDDRERLVDLLVSVSLENDECERWQARVASLEVGATYRLEPRGLSLSGRRLATRTEAERTSLIVEVACGSLSRRHTFAIELLAFDQWPGVGHWPEMTAAFVTPNHARVATWLGAARASLGALSDCDALDGYQSGSRQRAAHIAEACFNALATQGLGYINPPASFEQHGQRVRLADRLHRERLGTCLDLTLVLASLWEQSGLHPVVLLPEGHALPALWTHEAHLPESVIDEPARIRNLIELGELVAVESTHLTNQGVTFAVAVEAARQKMRSPGESFCAIDIRSCRKRGVRPLPLRDDAGESSAIDIDALERAQPRNAPSTPLEPLTLAERAEGRLTTRQETERDRAGGVGRIERWRTRLLDLSLRNRLVNFRETGRTLRLTVPDVAALEDKLAAGETFSIWPAGDGDEAFLREEFDANRVYSAEPPAATNKRMLNLYRTARSSIEETGANLLHLAVGTLKWFETESAETPRYAPIILLPVTLQRSTNRAGYRYDLSLSEEPLRPNVTLLEKLRNEFGLDTRALHELPEDENGLDVPLILRSFRTTIREMPRWEVEESMYLGLFSFNKFLMWRDLQENLDQLKLSRLVAHLVERPGAEFDREPYPQAEEMDERVQPGELFCTRDADSTQIAAVRATSEGRTFVLEGPPGTGKSQTIANMVADSLARGKRVLFVAEKMAALGVVRRRLEEDGLGPFCLELHSAKASKKQVLEQLQSALNATQVAHPADWDTLCGELRLTRDRLNRYVSDLHEPRATGETLYRVMGRLSLLGDGPRVEWGTPDVADTPRERLDAWRHSVEEVVSSAAAVDPPAAHPLRGIGQTQWRFDLPSRAEAAISDIDAALGVLNNAMQSFARAAAVELHTDALSRAAVQLIAAFAYQLRQLSEPIPSAGLLVGASRETVKKTVVDAVARGRARDKLRAELLGRYREEFLELDHLVELDALRRAQRLPSLLGLIACVLVRRRLRPYATSALPSIASLATDLEAARQFKREDEALRDLPEVERAVGPLWRRGRADWDRVDQLLSRCEAVARLLGAMQREPGTQPIVRRLIEVVTDGTRLEAAQLSSTEAVSAWNGWTRAWEALKALLNTSGRDAFGDAPAGWMPEARATFARWRSGMGELDRWCGWRRARQGAVDLGLGELVDAYERGTIARDTVSDVFERSFGEAWFNAVANQVETIRGFSVEHHQAAIERFRQVDRSLIHRAQAAVAARLASSTPQTGGVPSGQSEMGILRRELEKKRRHLPTRRLIEVIPNLLAKLKPCFLMSPLSVAQYLDARLPAFDLVVFDEASQIPVWDAIGAIARGTSVVVVGDSRQLPPTTFFDSVGTEDEELDAEDVAVDDMESILQECNASGIPRMQLRWHYRSRHESLIAFSNHHYYDNALHTFPSPQECSAELGVTLRHVTDGVYDRGASRTNRVEARAVVTEVVRQLREPGVSRSVGIVTFNQAQQMLIEDLLDDERRQHPEIEPCFSKDAEEPVFVKNLENVQGDERDTIIFSVGYGPDQTGRPSMNFGPLNKDGGERRLNVAVTRARRRLIIFSSLRADQIDLRRTQAVGVRHFKTFLDYADRGPRAIAEAVEVSRARAFDSGFEKAVWRALVDRGWEVDTQVGCAGYRVDLAVRDPDRPGRYLLGIECDGATYHSARTARDRDRLRQSVLEGLGWRVHRIWSTEWRINADRCMQRVEEALRSAQAATGEPVSPVSERAGCAPVAAAEATGMQKQPAAPVVTRQVDPATAEQRGGDRTPLYASAPATATPSPRTDSALTTYTPAECPEKDPSRFDIYDPTTLPLAAAALGVIVASESPVVDELAVRRLAEWFGGVRVTERFRARFGEIERAAAARDLLSRSGEVFWVPGSSEDAFTAVRTPGDEPASRRDLEQVPLVERINAVVYVLQTQFGLPRDELRREVAKLFGVQRLTTRIAGLIDGAIEVALDTGRAAVDGDRITPVAS
jgi:very-short-patch-repair endonuclease